MARRHHWTPDQVDAQDADFIDELMLAEIGFDLMVQARQERQQARSGGNKPLYGQGGMAG